MPTYLTHLECADCAAAHEATAEQHRCRACGGILLARYDLAALRHDLRPADWAARPAGLWRYAELLPVADPARQVTLGEGGTPLLPLPTLGATLDIDLWLKDEGLNPTGTFKARGAAVGVARARELGASTLALPTAGNAGAAWSAYGAAAGLPVVVAMPQDAPPVNQRAVRRYGARLHLVDGLISDAGTWIAAQSQAEGWYNAATFNEPYRLEGKKTLGLEIAEQSGWAIPDVILYPTGGGVGLIGLWKAFDELRDLGWLPLDQPLPRLVVVQAAGCAPVARAWAAGASTTTFWDGAATAAAGLRVPGPLAGSLMLRVLHETEGTAVTVDDAALLAAVDELARLGVWVCPDGAALLPAVRHLRATGWIRPGARVVLLNTGSGLIYE